MNSSKLLLMIVVLLMGLLSSPACAEGEIGAFSSQTVLIGSTPGDAAIKSVFSIAADKPIDFIRWNLVLDQAGAEKAFTLHINYGEGEPNTPGFKGGGERLSFTGKYTVSKSRNSDVIKLESSKFNGSISMIKLSENNFHLLNADGWLMVGNGGWSYTLNKKDPASIDTKLYSSSTSLMGETTTEVIFDGRTPCAEIAGEYKWTLERECPKLKWKLTLYRDPQTHQPTEYALQRTLERPNTLKGKWTLIDSPKAGSEALILKLDPDIPEKTISFLVGDENVLFFLDKQGRLYAGNGHFSYTLNRAAK